jgi:hypothetical protein
MPTPEYLSFTPASTNDVTTLKTTLPTLTNRTIIGDKIFASAGVNKQPATQAVEIITPVKLKRGQKQLPAGDKLLSSLVSSVSQSVESFFNWLLEKIQIQTACKVRSLKGVWVHCFGRIATALFSLFLTFDPVINKTVTFNEQEKRIIKIFDNFPG